MKQFFVIFLLFSFFILTPIAFNQQLLPSLFSYQDKINPETLNDYLSSETTGYFNNKSVSVPQFQVASADLVLGENTSNKRIEVNLTNQHTYAYEGDKLIYDFVISSGLWGRTHPGEYKIWAMVKKQKMSGGSKELGTYYYLPNVPNVMFFYNNTHPKMMGYSLHGAYWHNNFGVPMSHGCVNMKISDSETLFNWAQKDIPVIIYGKYDPKLAQK